MSAKLRVVDTGVRGARKNLAVTAALAELHRNGEAPATLRFQHFTPSAIVGRHQILTDVVRLDHCLAAGIETARRQTGGGAIYMGPGILGFELIAPRSALVARASCRRECESVAENLGLSLDAISAALCTALAGALSTIGIDARYRPRNDVEVDGAKISGTGGFTDGGTLVFQGTVLAAFDVADMAAALVLPRAKLDRKGLEALAQRVTSLQRLLGAAPPMRTVETAISAAFAGLLEHEPEWHEGLSEAEEQAAAKAYAEEVGQDVFVLGDFPGRRTADAYCAIDTPGGRVEAAAKIGPGGVIERIWITGDVFVTPPRLLPDLEAALASVPLQDAEAITQAFLERGPVDMLGLTARDLIGLVARLAAPLTEETHRPP